MARASLAKYSYRKNDMHLLEVLVYSLAAVCFIAAIFRREIKPSSLDFVALGLFFFVCPEIIRHISHML